MSEYGAKGHRSAPVSSNHRPAGRYVLLREVIGGRLEGLSAGDSVYLSSEEASRLHTIIAPERDG